MTTERRRLRLAEFGGVSVCLQTEIAVKDMQKGMPESLFRHHLGET